MTTDQPIAYCVLKAYRNDAGRVTGHQWHVPLCPYCAKRHTHGAGELEGDPRALLGARLAHCHPSPRGTYVLAEQPA